MRFAWIHVEKATYAVRRLCRVLAVTPSGYCAWMHRLPSQRARDNDRLQVRIRAIHAASRGTYGSPRVHEQLTQEGCAVGRERVARLLRDMGLVGLPARRVRHTTDSTHGRPVAPNVLERHFEADHPNQRWTTDITFIWTREGWLYLAVVLDLYARRVVGWAVHSRTCRRSWPWRRCSWRWGDACPPPVWCTIPIGAASMPPRLISVCCASMGSSVR